MFRLDEKNRLLTCSAAVTTTMRNGFFLDLKTAVMIRAKEQWGSAGVGILAQILFFDSY